MHCTLILVKTNTFIGKQIRRITKSEYNHVGLFVNDYSIIESKEGQGVILTPFKKYQKKAQRGKLSYDLYKLKTPITQEQFKVVKAYLLKQLGKKYDIMQFLSLLIFFIFHVNRNVNPIDIENAFICSELVGKAFNKINILFNSEIELDNLTPKDIACSDIIEKV